MWTVINTKTKEILYSGKTYKQCLNYIKIEHKNKKENLNIVVNDKVK